MKTLLLGGKKLLAFLLFWCFCIHAYGQASAYTYSQYQGTYTPITGTQLDFPTLDDNVSPVTNIGFSFLFNGVAYTQFTACTNGWIHLGSNTITSNSSPISTATQDQNPLISFFGRDGSVRGSVAYELEGIAPNRVLTVQYTNYNNYYGTSPMNTMNAQIKLYETSNKIEIVYGSLAWTSNGIYTGQVGISSSNTNFNNRTATGSWTTTNAGTTNEATLTLSQSVFPPSGLTYVWEPPTCIAPTGLVASTITSNSANVSWTAPLDAPANGYEYAYTTTNVAPPSGTTTSTTSANITGLSANTTYYFWVRSLCSSTESSAWTNFTLYTGYCIPTGSTTYHINSVSTTNAATNLSFTNSTAAVYLDRSTVLFNTYPGNEFNVSIAPNGGASQLYYMWVDWNNDLDFNDPGEAIFATTTSASSYTGTVTVPTGQALGNYRVRIAMGTSGGTIPISPCSSSYGRYVDFTMVVAAAPSCFAPSAVNASAITLNAATVSWTAPITPANDGYEYYLSTTNTAPSPATPGTGTSTTTSVDLSNLTANTNYYVWVRSACSNTDKSAWTTVTAFRTGYCIPTSSSTYYLKDVVSTNAVQNINFSQTSALAYNDASSTQILRAYPTQTVNITLTPNSGTNIFYVWIDWNNDLDFADAGETILATTTYAANHVLALTIPANQPIGSYRVRAANSWSGNIPSFCGPAAYGTFVDFTLEVVDAPLCLVPTALTSSLLTSSSGTISWTPPVLNPPANGYEYYISTANTAPTAPTPGVAVPTGTTVTIPGLTPNTIYYVWVRSICSSTEVSDWVGTPISFTTQCGATDVPYLVNFEEVSTPALPVCTSVAQAGTGNLWVTADNPGYGYTSKALRYGWNSSNPANTWFYTQGVNLQAGVSYRISYNYGGASTSFVEKLKVAYGTAPETASMTNVLADHSNINQVGPIYSDIDFVPTTSGVYYFGFNAYSAANQFYLFVDDILVDLTPTCLPVLPPTASNVMSSSADLSWVAPTTVPAEGYEYYISTSNTAPGATTAGVAVPTGTTVSITDLQYTTTYYVWVRSICSETDASNWSAAATFTTQCGPELAPTAVQTFTSLLSNVNTSLPCWSEGTSVAADPFAPTVGTSNWTYEYFGNVGTNNAAYFNIYRSSGYSWLMSNQIDLGATPGLFRVKYDFKVTDYNDATLTENAYGANVIDLIISTDGGTTWSAENILYSHAGTYNGETQVMVDLTNYSGVVKFALRVTENDAIDIDIDFFVDNFVVEEIPTCTEAVTIAGGGLVCAEDDLAPVTVTLPDAGSWEITINDGTNSAVVTATGPEYTFIPTVEGVYTVTAANGACVVETFAGSAEVARRAPLTAQNPQSICFGGSYTIGTSTYTTAGTFTDVLTSAVNGCDSTVTTVITILPQLTSNNPQTICEGQSYSIGTSTYSTPGTYTDVLTAVIGGCDSTVTTVLTLVDIAISVSQDNEIFTTVPVQGATYQWVNCDTEEVVATTADFTATANGLYKLVVTLGDCSEESTCYEVEGLKTDVLDALNLMIYPNPTTGTVTIEVSTSMIDKVEILDVNGRLVETVICNSANPSLSLAQYENGVYLVRIHADGKQVVRRVTKQ